MRDSLAFALQALPHSFLSRKAKGSRLSHEVSFLHLGERDWAGGTFGRFDPLYGSRRAELAPSGLYSVLARTNILSPGARVEVTPSKRVDAFLGYRAAWLAQRHDAFAGTGVRDAPNATPGATPLCQPQPFGELLNGLTRRTPGRRSCRSP